MSKYLIKILSICAFVVLLPLIVVGSALCVTEAMGITLTVRDSGIEGGYAGASSEVSIYIDGEKQEGTKITIKKNTDVTVTYEGEGYDFQGWYKGNPAEIGDNARAESTKTSYSFTVRGTTVLTAIRNVKTYTVTYTGQYDDGTAIDVTPETENVVYGQPLAPVTPKGDGVIWGGWYDINSNSLTGTKVANFAESGEYTLNPIYSNQMIVKYYKNETLISTEIVTQEGYASYALLSGTDEKVVNVLTAGYSFNGWDYNGSTITALSEFKPEGYALYLKETANTYNVTVKYNAVSSDTQNITYDVVNGFGSYNTTRTGYTFKGFEYNGKLYAFDAQAKDYVASGEKLSGIVIANNGLSVTAKWESKYEVFLLNIAARAHYNNGTAEGDWNLKNDNGTLSINGMNALSINFVDDNDEDSYDMTDNVFVLLTKGNNNIVTKEGNAVQATGVIRITANESNNRYEFVTSDYNTFTFVSLMNKLETEGVTDTLDTVTIEFMYELV